MVAAGVSAVAACADPSDVLYQAGPVPPLEVKPGLFRLTFDPHGDYVRGFTTTGDTILFRGQRSIAVGDVWQILGVPVAGDPTAEQVHLYRSALRQPLGSLEAVDQARFLSWWQPGTDGSFYGPAGCPGPASRRLQAWMQGVFRLPNVDGAALSSVPFWLILTPSADTLVNSSALIEFRTRFDFAQIEAERGANAFGPNVSTDGRTGFYSDGELVWRFDPTSAIPAPDSITHAIFPRVSPDGARLAVAVPEGVDSVEKVTNGSTGVRQCLQDEWSLTATGWHVVVTNLGGGDTVRVVRGTEPVFDSAGARIVVRRGTGLVLVDLASGAESPVPGTEGAFAAAWSPDGSYLAFSATVSNNTDVYFVKLN